MTDCEINELKKLLSKLIFEHDDLMAHVCPDIEIRYVLEFGTCEYELYKIELEIDRLERKLQLIHEGADLKEIEKKLDKEFDESQRQLKVQIEEINYLKIHGAKKLPSEDLKKLNETYLMLIERLHPYLNPNQTSLELSLFLRTEFSYKRDDLEALESVVRVLPEEDTSIVPEIEDLNNLISEFEGKIDEIKSDYPYNKKELLEDDDSRNEYKEMLLDLIDERKKGVSELENKINESLQN